MFLGGRQSPRGVKNKWGFSEKHLPEGIMSENDAVLMLNNIRNDENVEDAIEKIILGHTRMALSLAGKYIFNYNCHYFASDMESGALEGLVVGANKLSTIKHDNVAAFLTLCIHNALKDCGRKRYTVWTPIHRREPVRSVCISDKHYIDYTNRNRESEFLHDMIKDYCDKNINKEELLDEITVNDEERSFANLRIRGFSHVEIAVILGVQLSRIYTIRKKLRERYNERREN